MKSKTNIGSARESAGLPLPEVGSFGRDELPAMESQQKDISEDNFEVDEMDEYRDEKFEGEARN
jgi:hypothetical protein